MPQYFADGLFKAVEYGKCVVSDYNSVHKDKCVKEFLKLKDCYLVRLASVPDREICASFLDMADPNQAAAKGAT